MNIIQLQDCPTKGPHFQPRFQYCMSKTASYCCRLTELMWGTNCVCLLDLGFGYCKVLTELEKKGVKATIMLKRKGVSWPAGSHANNITCHMQGKDVGYQTAHKASNPNYPDKNLWIVAMADSKHTSIMCNTWSTTLLKGKRTRQVGRELIKIDYSKYIYWYYYR